MSADTKGPWSLGKLGNKGRISVDSVGHTSLAKVVWLMDCDKEDGRPSPECEANARLIAAAPELLAALKGIVSLSSAGSSAASIALEAIAKAEGKQ